MRRYQASHQHTICWKQLLENVLIVFLLSVVLYKGLMQAQAYIVDVSQCLQRGDAIGLVYGLVLSVGDLGSSMETPRQHSQSGSIVGVIRSSSPSVPPDLPPPKKRLVPWWLQDDLGDREYLRMECWFDCSEFEACDRWFPPPSSSDAAEVISKQMY